MRSCCKPDWTADPEATQAVERAVVRARRHSLAAVNAAKRRGAMPLFPDSDGSAQTTRQSDPGMGIRSLQNHYTGTPSESEAPFAE